MNSRLGASLLIAGTIVALACVDMSAPEGPASISEIQLPSPSVIIGDTMRDSTGAVAPIRVIAFDANGIPILDAVTDLFITDSAAPAHLGPLGTLVGDRLGTVHLLGQVNELQTPGITIPVTRRPATLVAGTVAPVTAPLGDSTQRGRSAIPAAVRSALDSASQGIVVQFTLVYAPASLDPARPAVYLADDAGKPSPVDTSDASGTVSRALTVVSAFLADPDLVAGTRTDSAVVEVSASYAGVRLAGSPVRYVVPIEVKLVLGNAAPFRRTERGDILAASSRERGSGWAPAVNRETPRQAR